MAAVVWVAIEILRNIGRVGEDSFCKRVVVLLVWLGMESALVQGFDGGNIK